MSLAHLKETILALPEPDLANLTSWFASIREGTADTPAPAAAKRPPVTLEGPAEKQGETQPDGALPPAAKRARLGGGEDDSATSTAVPPKKAAPRRESGATPRHLQLGGIGTGDAGKASKGGSDSGTSNGAVAWEETEGVASVGWKSDATVAGEDSASPAGRKGAADAGEAGQEGREKRGKALMYEESEDEDERKGGSSGAPGEVNDNADAKEAANADGDDEEDEDTSPLSLLAKAADAVSEGPELRSAAIAELQREVGGGKEHFGLSAMEEAGFKQYNPKFAYGNADAFYMALLEEPGGAYIIHIGMCGKHASATKNKGSIDRRLYAVQSKRGRYGLVKVYRIDSSKILDLEEMIKICFKCLIGDECTGEETFYLPSKETATRCALRIDGYVQGWLKDGKMNIPSSAGRMDGDKMSILRSDPNYFNAVRSKCGIISEDHRYRRQLSKEFASLEDFSSKFDFMKEHRVYDATGRLIAPLCVKKWLQREIRPKAKWSALAEDQRAAIRDENEQPPPSLETQNRKKWDEKLDNHFLAFTTWQANLGITGVRPPGNKRRAYFLPDDDDKDKAILDLGVKVQTDINKFRREGEDGASDFVKEKYRRYRQCGLAEFGSARLDAEGSARDVDNEEEEGSVRDEDEEDNESSELTLLQYMEATGLLVRDDSGALISARGLEDEKREWLESLQAKIRPSQMLSCACGEPHDPEHYKCIGKTCDNCSMWHWVSHRCLQMSSKATAQREPWTCIDCGGERVENAHAEEEERAAAQKAEKEKAAADKAAAEEAADDANEVIEENMKPSIIRGVKSKASVNGADARDALERHDWDAEKAVAFLLNK